MIRGALDRRPDPRTTFAVLAAMMTAVTVLQRISLPFGQISFALVVVLAGVTYLLLSGALVEDRLRAGLYLLAIAVCLLAAAISLAMGKEGSLSSVLLLVVLYAPFAYVLKQDASRFYPRLLEYFCRLMVVGSVLSLAQWAAQVAGWQYSDPFDLLPDQLLLHGYNTTYALEYGSGTMKSNGVFFLEPSFCSQFLALATIIQLARGDKRWRVPLLVAGIIPTLSGTGLLLLAFGLIVLSLRRGPLWIIAILATVATVSVATIISPAGALFAARAAESRTSESSVSLRFFQPYSVAYDQLGAEDSAPLIGRGPGFVEREAADHFSRTDLSLAFPVVPKLMAEYGLIAAFVFLVFTVAAFWSGAPSPIIASCVLFMHLTLSGSLLQPQTVYLSFLLTSFFAAPRLPASFRVRAAIQRLSPA
jgi:hypothetical protein